MVVSGDTLYVSGTKDIGKALEAMVDIYANPTPENVGKHFVEAISRTFRTTSSSPST